MRKFAIATEKFLPKRKPKTYRNCPLKDFIVEKFQK